MAVAEHPTSAAQPPEVQPQSQPQPEHSDTTPKPRRKTSFSDALNKFASNTFTRRRTTTNLPHSTSLASVHTQSRLPTPSGIPRSTSFFSTLNSFKSATTAPATSTRSQIKPREKSKTNSTDDGNSNHNGKESKASFPKSTSTSTSGIPIALTSSQKKVGPNLAPSHRRISTPYRHLTDPVTPSTTNTQKSKTTDGNTTSSSSKSKSRRESSVQITQHKLMQPLPPPLPKTNSTMSSLMAGSSANIVGSARTSMSSKRDSGVMVGGTGTGNANINVNINANANANRANANIGVSSKTLNQTETETDTKTPSPVATKTKSPAQTQPQSPPDINKPLPDFHTNPLYIKDPQPSAYWCGRLSALNDRFRMEDITNTSSSSASPSNKQLSAAHRKLSDDERRIRRIFVHLQGLCVTEEVRASLDAFQRAWEKKEGGGAGVGAGGTKGAGGFLEKLMGKK